MLRKRRAKSTFNLAVETRLGGEDRNGNRQPCISIPLRICRNMAPDDTARKAQAPGRAYISSSGSVGSVPLSVRATRSVGEFGTVLWLFVATLFSVSRARSLAETAHDPWACI
jgi:hypothetical protein